MKNLLAPAGGATPGFTIRLCSDHVKGPGIRVHWDRMFCPECVPLVPELPPKLRPEYVEYVTVLKTGNPIVIAMVKSILESAGIRHFVKGEVLQDLFRVGTAEIQVGREDEQEARELLRERAVGP